MRKPPARSPDDFMNGMCDFYQLILVDITELLHGSKARNSDTKNEAAYLA